MKSAAIGIRVEPAFRDKLQAEADLRGKPLTHEIERRIRASFDGSVLPPDLQARLTAAAAASGRSEEDELAERLRTTFRDDDSDVGFETVRLTTMMKMAISMIELRSGKRWIEDLPTWHAAQRAIRDIMKNVRDHHRDQEGMLAVERPEAVRQKQMTAHRLFGAFVEAKSDLLNQAAAAGVGDSTISTLRLFVDNQISDSQSLEQVLSPLDPELMAHLSDQFERVAELRDRAMRAYDEVDELAEPYDQRRREADRVGAIMARVAQGGMGLPAAEAMLERRYERQRSSWEVFLAHMLEGERSVTGDA